jgi:hypothetical protein
VRAGGRGREAAAAAAAAAAANAAAAAATAAVLSPRQAVLQKLRSLGAGAAVRRDAAVVAALATGRARPGTSPPPHLDALLRRSGHGGGHGGGGGGAGAHPSFLGAQIAHAATTTPPASPRALGMQARAAPPAAPPSPTRGGGGGDGGGGGAQQPQPPPPIPASPASVTPPLGGSSAAVAAAAVPLPRSPLMSPARAKHAYLKRRGERRAGAAGAEGDGAAGLQAPTGSSE